MNITDEYARRLKEIEKVCEIYGDNLQDDNDRSISTMLSYLIHIKQLASGVVRKDGG